jgi:hypothetical protein
MNSDEFTTRALYFNSKSVAFSQGVFYYRQNNKNAITKKWNSLQLDCFETSYQLEKYVIQNGFGQDAVELIHKTILLDLVRIRLMFLKSKSKMEVSEKRHVEDLLKDIYYHNLPKFKNLQSTSPKQFIMINAVRKGYFSYLVYTYLHQFFLKITNVGK